MASVMAERDPDKVSQQFSSLFIGLLLKKALDSSWSQDQEQDPDQPKPIYGRDKEVYRDMLYQQLVSQLVEEDAFGLRAALTQKNLLQNKASVQTDPARSIDRSPER